MQTPNRKEHKTKEIFVKFIAIFSQISYLLGEGWHIPFIFSYQIPGSKPKVIIHGHPKEVMRLAARADAEEDIFFGKITFVEILSEPELDGNWIEIEDTKKKK